MICQLSTASGGSGGGAGGGEDRSWALGFAGRAFPSFFPIFFLRLFLFLPAVSPPVESISSLLQNDQAEYLLWQRAPSTVKKMAGRIRRMDHPSPPSMPSFARNPKKPAVRKKPISHRATFCGMKTPVSPQCAQFFLPPCTEIFL